jgi:hypothetical protein
MKQHYCPAEKTVIDYEGECNWCGEKEMNERIRQLALQAQKVVRYTDGGYTEIKALDQEKFAELIVRECADIATIHQQNHAHDSIGRYVLDHFGIAEREDPVQVSNLHYCPYAAEINGDYETLCDCDEERTYQCAMDV